MFKINLKKAGTKKRVLNKYIKELERRGLTKQEIERELLVDPESPVVMWGASITEQLFGERPRHTREELEEDFERRKEEKQYRWVTIESSDPKWPKRAEKIFANEEFEKFGQPGTGPCPDCAPRAGQVETMEIWEMIGTPGSGFSVCRSACRCKLVLESTTED